jgi:hypothetical protein
LPRERRGGELDILAYCLLNGAPLEDSNNAGGWNSRTLRCIKVAFEHGVKWGANSIHTGDFDTAVEYTITGAVERSQLGSPLETCLQTSVNDPERSIDGGETFCQQPLVRTCTTDGKGMKSDHEAVKYQTASVLLVLLKTNTEKMVEYVTI